MDRIVPRVALIGGAGFFLLIGGWAFFWPREFFDTIATYPPYNEHLFHDIGAFSFGLGVALLAALSGRSGVVVALAGAAAGAVLHAISHVMDRDLGGKSSDPWTLGLFAIVLVVGLVFSMRETRA